MRFNKNVVILFWVLNDLFVVLIMTVHLLVTSTGPAVISSFFCHGSYVYKVDYLDLFNSEYNITEYNFTEYYIYEVSSWPNGDGPLGKKNHSE